MGMSEVVEAFATVSDQGESNCKQTQRPLLSFFLLTIKSIQRFLTVVVVVLVLLFSQQGSLK